MQKTNKFTLQLKPFTSSAKIQTKQNIKPDLTRIPLTAAKLPEHIFRLYGTESNVHTLTAASSSKDSYTFLKEAIHCPLPSTDWNGKHSNFTFIRNKNRCTWGRAKKKKNETNKTIHTHTRRERASLNRLQVPQGGGRETIRVCLAMAHQSRVYA